MKNYIKHIILLTVIAFAAPSCESFLEEELVTVNAPAFYETPEGFEAAVNSTYSIAKDFFGQEIGGTMTVFGTDIFTNGADGSHKGFNQYDTRLNPSYRYSRDLWRDFYRGINQANAVIARSEGLDIPDADKQQRIAEVKFMRAIYYFTLVKQYGDVHLTLEETTGAEREANRTSREEVVTAIIADLDDAIATLPDEQSDYGRATRPAAEFIKAKVLITRAYWNNSAADFQGALDLMDGVINNYNFELLPVWADLWDIDNQRNSEVIWAFQNTTDITLQGGRGHRFHLYFLMEYDKLQGMQRDTENGRPWKRFKPTDFFLNMWPDGIDDMDIRYRDGFKHVWLANNEGSIPDDGSGNLAYNIGDTSVFLPAEDWTDAEKAAVDYAVYGPSDYTERIYATVNKFIDPTRPDRQWTSGQRDYVIARLADAYLIAAEALVGLGREADAVPYINAIRTRAAREGMEAAMQITAADVDLDYVLDERARELFGEGHRWEDLTRTGTLVERVRAHNVQGGGNIQDFHVLRAIPQDQIDRTPAGYPQNPGYN